MHVPDSSNIGGGGLYTIGPPKSVIGRHILNALVQENLAVLAQGGITPRANGAADAAAGYNNQLRDAIIAIANARFVALHPAAFTSEFNTVFASAWTSRLSEAMDNNSDFSDWVELLAAAVFTAGFPAAFTSEFNSVIASAWTSRLNDAMDNNTDFSDWIDILANARIAAAFNWQSVNIQIYDEDGVSLQGSTAMPYRVHADLVHLTLPELDLTLGGSAENIRIRGVAAIDLPAAIVVDSAFQATWVSSPVRVTVGGTDGVGGTQELAYLRPGQADGYFTLCRASGTPTWPTGTEIYVFRQTITYQAIP